MSLEVKRFPVTFASGATSSGGVDLTKAYQKVMLEMPSATTFNLYVRGSGDGTKYKRLYHNPADNDAVVTAVEITSATAGANGAIVGVPQWTRYMQLEAGTAVANGATYYFICID
jgi:hypothetical protein